ncbi:hypothetical protein [Micromonospora sp. NPDC047740]|uniref:hypothetical protein n=1 Tax=Micromonospora sp. NPDC047740 TaxID=3364254 RepID=UPI0037208E94
MFLSDPALRRIAAETNDVHREHLWRHDTAALDPLSDLARLLHKITLGFNDNTATLDKALARLVEQTEAAQRQLAPHADLHTPSHAQALTDVLAASERHAALADMLVNAYRAWRNHHRSGDSDERYVLLQPGDPTYGVATLRRHAPDAWLVLPDPEAANAFDVPYPCRVVGEVCQTDDGWAPVACTNPEHRDTQPAITYHLPTCNDLPAACRSLLRWWHLRHSAAWANRTPAQLTPAEAAGLSA